MNVANRQTTKPKEFTPLLGRNEHTVGNSISFLEVNLLYANVRLYGARFLDIRETVIATIFPTMSRL